MRIEKYGSKYWAVYDDSAQLICLTVYKKGACEVVQRLNLNRTEPHNLEQLSR